MESWIQTCYTRLLIDNHITEDDPVFLTKFDPRHYVDMVQTAGVEAAMVYACCHNGNCYYPTRVGHMHCNLGGRDIFGETVNLLRQSGIHPIAYYTSVFHNQSAKDHPAWRMQDVNGKMHNGRYWWSCPNNPDYAAFTRAQISEVIAYDVDGIFIDMTFWPAVCCCTNCRSQYFSQTGSEIPEKVDWSDPGWVRFQRFREQSMADFCADLAADIKRQKPITVTVQNSPIIFGWQWGQAAGVADACDYTSGDFYGGKYQHVLGAKILAAASKNPPFEYMTSRCVNLNDHTSMKAEAELRCEAATTLASGGAPFFIDAINPDGTLNPAVYRRLGRVSRSLAPFAASLKTHRPALWADHGLYFSMPSLVNLAQEGKSLPEIAAAGHPTITPPYEEMLGTSLILTRAHRLFKVVRHAEGDLGQLRALIMNNVQFMTEAECDKVREFVRAGGVLLATGLTSLRRLDGSSSGDFALADVFGVSYLGRRSQRIHYLALPGEQNLVSCDQPGALVRLAGAQPLGELVEPYFDPDDARQYASIHSNPPGRPTGSPGLSHHSYGLGRCIYLASPLLALQQDAQQAFAAELLQEYIAPGLLAGTNAPGVVEITLLRSTTANACLVGLVNYQKELPNVTVQDLWVNLRLKKGVPRHCRLVSNGQELPFGMDGEEIYLKLPALETIEMVEVSWD